MAGTTHTKQIDELMRPAIAVTGDITLHDALSRMIKERRNSLVVVDEAGALIGAVNAVDIIKEVLPDYLEEDEVAAHFADDTLLKEDAIRVKDKPVSEFMSTEIASIHTDGSLVEAAVLATKHGRGRIIVVDDANKPLGVLTRTEIKQVVASFLDIETELD